MRMEAARLRILGIMRTEAELRRGLAGRVSVPENEVMVFVHEPPWWARYHMRDTLVPLEIAFLDLQMRIDKIVEMPDQRSRAESNGPCPMALEAALGTFARTGIDLGYRVEIDTDREEAVFHPPGKPDTPVSGSE